MLTKNTRGMLSKLRSAKATEDFPPDPKTPAATHKTLPSPHTLLTHFKNYGDDSSDEEEVSAKVKNYQINEHWLNSQTPNKTQTRNPFNNDFELSFITHATANRFLHSLEVNHYYYPLKNRLLTEKSANENLINQLHKLIKKGITHALEEGIKAINRFLKIAEDKQLSAQKLTELSTHLRLNFLKDIDKLIDENLEYFIRWMKCNKYDAQEKIPDDILSVENTIVKLLIAKFNEVSPFKKSNQDRSKVREELLELAKETALNLVEQFHFEKLCYANGKMEALTILSQYQGSHGHQVHILQTLLKKAYAQGSVLNMLKKQLENKYAQENLIQAYLEDLLITHSGFVKKSASFKGNKNPMDEPSILRDYFSVDTESMADDLGRAFFLQLRHHLPKAIRAFYRPTLGTSYTLTSHNPYEFYALLHLSMWSQKRQILNLKNALFKNDCATRTWRLGEPTHPNESDVTEIQHILVSAGRVDIIENLGNYEKVYEAINQLKTDLQFSEKAIDDSQIAQWIRQAFIGVQLQFDIPKIDSIVITNKIKAIAVLLFGCEATRNPAMILINQMLLDLIIEQKGWSFEEAFTQKVANTQIDKNPKIMPMIPEGAVAVARALESEYRRYMPVNYSYPGITEYKGKEELIKNEGRVVRDWLNREIDLSQCKISNDVLSIQLRHKQQLIKIPVDEAPEWIGNFIVTHYKNWFSQQPTVTTKAEEQFIHRIKP